MVFDGGSAPAGVASVIFARHWFSCDDTFPAARMARVRVYRGGDPVLGSVCNAGARCIYGPAALVGSLGTYRAADSDAKPRDAFVARGRSYPAAAPWS